MSSESTAESTAEEPERRSSLPEENLEKAHLLQNPSEAEFIVSPAVPLPIAPEIPSTATEQETIQPKTADLSFSLADKQNMPSNDETVHAEIPLYDVNQDKNDAAPPGSLKAQFQATGRIPIGTKLGHFAVTKYIGGGGMGRVYEGIDTALDRKVAIKILPRQRTEDTAAVARFLNEARSAARLNHEHIAQVYFCGESDGIPFIAFEYVEGINVRAFVEANGPIPLEQGINFLIQIAGALAHAAMHGVTHRDVKPSNILITPQGKAKLIDMGLARLLRSDPQEDLTVSGVTLGTFDYISPEQARDPRVADVRSDIYSLGCTFFFMLTGHPPFPEGTVLQKLLQHQGDDPPDIRQLVPGTPDEVSALILKMMAKDPADRFQSPDELSQALSAIAHSIGLHPAESEQAGPIRKRLRTNPINIKRHLPWVTSVALLLVCVAAIRFFSQNPDEASIIPPLDFSGSTAGTISTTAPAPLPEVENQLVPPQRVVMTRIIGTVPREETVPIISAEYPIRPFSDTGRDGKGLGVVPLALSQALSDPSLLNQPERTTDALRRTISPAAGKTFGEWSLARDLTALPNTEFSENTENIPPAAIVDHVGEKPNCFASLTDAVHSIAEQTNSSAEKIIELAYEGTDEIDSFTLTGQNIRITAQSGLKPRLAFVPQNSSAMAELVDSHLTIDGLEIDFAVPPVSGPMPKWSLFQLCGSTSLTIKNSTVTIQDTVSGNSAAGSENSRNWAAFCRIVPEQNPQNQTKASSDAIENQNSASHVQIDLSRLLARGEAVFCSAESNASVQISAVSTGTVLSGPFILQQGTGSTAVTINRSIGIFRGPFAVLTDQSRRLDSLQASMTHTLFLMNHQPIGRLEVSEPLPEIPALNWNLSESIICRATALLQIVSVQYPDYRSELAAAGPLFWGDEKEDTAWDRLMELAPHRISTEDIGDTLFRSVYLKVNTASEKAALEAIESGILPSPEEKK